MRSPLGSLRNFANVAVGVSLGFGGQSILWKTLAGWELLKDYRDGLRTVHRGWFVLCVVALVSFIGRYSMKAMYHFDIVRAEFCHPIRINFFCGPCIAILMIALSWPTSGDDTIVPLQIIWTVAFVYQMCAALVIYHRWLYTSSTSDLAAAPYLLSIVSWLLLSNLGQSCGIDDGTGVPLSAMCFGVGAFFSLLMYPHILLGIFAGRTEAGSPALFLIIAPISVAGLGLQGLSGNDVASQSIFGIALFFFIFLLRSRPTIFARPSVFGVYWAYVFPNAALAALSIKLAGNRDRPAMNFIAILLACFAVMGVLLVLVRMSSHMIRICRGLDTWSDPIVVAKDSAVARDVEIDVSPIGKEQAEKAGGTD